MLEYVLGESGNFEPANKAFHYPDSPGSVKNVSALHPLGLAYVTDNERLFREQGIPIMEFLLSREKFLFALNDDGMESSQRPSMKMAGPAMPLSELAALERIAGGATPYFRQRVERLYVQSRTLNMDWVSPAGAWQNDLWRYRATGERKWLDAAVANSEPDLAKVPTDFSEAANGTFFEYLLPAWKDFYELYRDTHAPIFLRIAQDTNDSFLRDIARSAMIGRFANFPGYHFNTLYSTAQEKANFPLHSHEELKPTTSFHYNHVLPMANLVLDYLFAKARDRSQRAIDFPYYYAECYAFMQSGVYTSPGSFYDQQNIRPWMPTGLIKSDNIQVNHLAAIGEDTLCISLMNECERELEDVTNTIDLGRFEKSALMLQATVWQNNQQLLVPSKIEDGRVHVTLSPKGITALIIPGLKPKMTFQSKLRPTISPSKTVTHQRVKTSFGDVEVMVLSFGPDLTWLYAYLTADRGRLESARIKVQFSERAEQFTDNSYPFEFSIPLRSNDKQMRIELEATSGNDPPQKSESIELNFGDPASDL
jgi:hypothetical protein